MDSIEMKVEGMSCGGCVRGVTRALEAIEGVRVSRVEIGSAAVAYDPGATSPEQISNALARAGYGVARMELVEDAPPSSADHRAE